MTTKLLLRRRVLAGAMCATLAAAAPASIHAQSANSRSSRSDAGGITIPVSGTAVDDAGAPAGTFTGAFQLREFTARGNQVFALGIVTGTLTNAAGVATSVARTVAVPVAVGEGPAPPAQGVVIQQVCDILHLELGPLNLDLLGLVVNLNRVILDIDAVSGAGNLLGNLLCAVVGLLDNPGALSGLLNRILAIIS
jgi:hypothetical protein